TAARDELWLSKYDGLACLLQGIQLRRPQNACPKVAGGKPRGKVGRHNVFPGPLHDTTASGVPCERCIDSSSGRRLPPYTKLLNERTGDLHNLNVQHYHAVPPHPASEVQELRITLCQFLDAHQV